MLCARHYAIIMSFDAYKDHPLQIKQLRLRELTRHHSVTQDGRLRLESNPVRVEPRACTLIPLRHSLFRKLRNSASLYFLFVIFFLFFRWEKKGPGRKMTCPALL